MVIKNDLRFPLPVWNIDLLMQTGVFVTLTEQQEIGHAGIKKIPYDLEIVNTYSTFMQHGFDCRNFGRRGLSSADQP